MTERKITEPGAYMGAQDVEVAAHVRRWLKTKDPRPTSGVIFLVLYDDGFSVQYLGAEQIDSKEVERRVCWIAEQIVRS